MVSELRTAAAAGRRTCSDASAPAKPGRATSVRLARRDPTTEQLDTIAGPRGVARHRPILKSVENVLGVSTDVRHVPQIKGEGHRVAVRPSEQRLDVSLEADR